MEIKRLKPNGQQIKISIVKSPAIEENFIALSKEKGNNYIISLTQDVEDKHIITGRH